MVNLKSIQKIHNNLMYHDKCDIFVYDKVKKDNGAISTKKSLTPIYKNVPCKISFSFRTGDMFNRKSIDTNTYEKQPKIFMDVEYKVEPGYYIEARRFDPKSGQLIATYKGQAGLPQVSLTHQEILLDVRGDS